MATALRAGRREHLVADLIGISPVTIIYSVFIMLPVLAAVALSFLRWNGLSAPTWIGLANWRQFVADPTAHQALLTTVKVVLLSWVIQTPISMALGIFVAGSQRYRAVYASIYILPLLLSTTGIALMWQALLEPEFGGLAWLSTHLGLHFLAQNWLASPSLTLYVLIALMAWQFIPFHTLLYQGGRRQIPEVLYEAARIDGAEGYKLFRHVTLPQLRYTIVTSTILVLVGSVTYFDIIYILTDGGPGNATTVLSLDMYNTAFVGSDFGYASVLAVVLGVLGVGIALALVKISGFGTRRMSSGQEGVS